MNIIRETSIRVRTFAGIGGQPGGATDDSLFKRPEGVATDLFDNIYVADSGNNKIKKISKYGLVSRIAGDGTASHRDNLPTEDATKAQFYWPVGIAVDNNGNIYVTETYRGGTLRFGFVRKLIPETNSETNKKYNVITIAGKQGDVKVDGDGLQSVFGELGGIAVDTQGNLYVADYGFRCIRVLAKVDETNYTVSTLTGSGLSELKNPYGICINSTGDLFVSDYGTHSVKKIIKPKSSVYSWVLQNVVGGNDADHIDALGVNPSSVPPITTKANTPKSITVDSNGNVFFVDSVLNTVRKKSSDSSLSVYNVTTVAGDPSSIAGFAPTDPDVGDENTTRFRVPTGIVVSTDGGLLYVADTGNHCIRKITLAVPKEFFVPLYRNWNFIGMPLNDTNTTDINYDNIGDDVNKLAFRITHMVKPNIVLNYQMFLADMSQSVAKEIQTLDVTSKLIKSYIFGVGGDDIKIEPTLSYFIRINNEFPEGGDLLWVKGVQWVGKKVTLTAVDNYINLPDKTYATVQSLFDACADIVEIQEYDAVTQLHVTYVAGMEGNLYGGKGYNVRLRNGSEPFELSFTSDTSW